MTIDPGFLNSNLIRSFPFVLNEASDVPNWLVVDFRAILHEGRWDPSRHRVYLAWAVRHGEKLRFGFRADAPDLQDEELVFERLFTDGRYLTTYAESSQLAETLEDRCGCDIELLCDAGFDGDSPDCSVELLCNPRLDSNCGAELLCETEELDP